MPRREDSTAGKYGTTNPVLIEARINHDPYDEFAWVQEWRFAIAQFLTDLGESVPGYYSGSGDDIRDTLEYETLGTLYPNYQRLSEGEYAQQIAALEYAARILDRYREWLRIAGRDY